MTARPSAVAGLALLAVWALSTTSAQAAAVRARSGDHLVERLEAANAAVVGVVSKPRSLDRQGYVAKLRVDTSLSGPIPKGAEIAIAWEELSPMRSPRFADGDRIVVALEPLPTASIWKQRLPDEAQRAVTSSVADRGKAFVRGPSQGSALALEHFLALSPRDRDAPAGVELLAQLTAGAQASLALSAAQRLARVPGLDARLSARSSRLLVDALLRSNDAEVLQAQLLELVGSRRLESLRSPLEARLQGEGPGPALVYAALGRLDGVLSPDRTALLLEQPSAEHRARAARYASGPGASDQLVRLLRSDPSSEVRVAAIERLVALQGDDAVEPVLRALGDPDRAVRGAAAGRLAAIGEPALPGLRAVAWGNDLEASRSSVAALSFVGPEGHELLVEIAESHPDPGVRTLADIALGRPIGHED